MTRSQALERILAMARKRGFEDGHAGRVSLADRAASPRELVVGLATAAGGGLLKVGEPDKWSAQVAAAYRSSYRAGAHEATRRVART